MCAKSCIVLRYHSEDGSLEQSIEYAFSQFERIEGGNIYALYKKTERTVEIMMELEKKYDEQTKGAIRRLTRFFADKKIALGDFFIRQMTSAPIPDQIRSYNKMYAIKSGLDWVKEDLEFCKTWLQLYLRFKTFSFGWLDEKVFVGESSNGKRICRFCSNRSDDKFTKTAHAISESLGNKHLFCNEECDDCNKRLAEIEQHFLRLMEIRRTLYRIAGKGTSSHCVEGENFVIKPNEKNIPIIYLKEEYITPPHDINKSFNYKLIHKWNVTNENIYKALVKYVIDLLPNEELKYFENTIEWINGNIISDELPLMLFGMHDRIIKHPIMDIYINNNGRANTPYCTAVFYLCDITYMFIIPFCYLDKGLYKTFQSLETHYNFMANHNYLVKKWEIQSTYEFWNCQVWCWWKMTPGNYEIRPSSDPIFALHEFGKKSLLSKQYPSIDKLRLKVKNVEQVKFILHINREVYAEEMMDSSNNLLKNDIVFHDGRHLSLLFAILLCDSDNKVPFFEYAFEVCFESEWLLSDYFFVNASGSFDIDNKLIAQIYNLGLTAAEKEIFSLREKTCFRNCKITEFLKNGGDRFLSAYRILLNRDFNHHKL